MTTSILLVDDHELIRQGLARAIERHGAMTVVGQAGTVGEARSAFRALRPDVVVTDLQLPDGTGLDVIRAIRAESAETGVVMLTMHSGDDQIFAAMEAGASAFIGKEARAGDVVNAALHTVKAPRSFLCPGLPGAMMRRASGAPTRLTPREQEVLELLADGFGGARIAKQLYMGESTAKTHIARIYDKLGASNRAEALVTAIRKGLLPDLVPTAR